MNTRTPLDPAQGISPSSPALPSAAAEQGPAGLDEDLRRFMSLTPMEQLERLEADSERINRREQAMRAAERELGKSVNANE